MWSASTFVTDSVFYAVLYHSLQYHKKKQVFSEPGVDTLYRGHLINKEISMWRKDSMDRAQLISLPDVSNS